MDGANNYHGGGGGGVMNFLEQWKGILKIQKFRRIASYTGFYCFVTVVTYAYTSNTTRTGMSRADQYYAAYPAGTELLANIAKLYKAALGNCFEEEDWGLIEVSIMAKHFERQGKPPYAYHADLKTKKLIGTGHEFGAIHGASSFSWTTRRWKRLDISAQYASCI